MHTFRGVAENESFQESDLAALAEKFRTTAGKRRADAARDMDVNQTSIFHAEESPEKSYTKLRIRMIEKYSPFKVAGPIYQLEKK